MSWCRQAIETVEIIEVQIATSHKHASDSSLQYIQSVWHGCVDVT